MLPNNQYRNQNETRVGHFDNAAIGSEVLGLATASAEKSLTEIRSSDDVLSDELKSKVEELKVTNEDLQRKKNFIASIMEVIPSLVFVIDDTTSEILYSNKCSKNDSEYPCLEQLIKLPTSNACKLCNVSKLKCSTAKYNGKNGGTELKADFENGEIKWYQFSERKLDMVFDDRTSSASIYSLSDITALKRNELSLIEKEEMINNSLREKELLLQEVHHRVKNNLQIIYGLLNLQAKSTQSVEVKLQLSEVQNRICSISLVHEELYQNENFLTIDLAVYCKKLCNTLLAIGSIADNVNFVFNLKSDLRIGIERATPLGLYINEVVSNCYKHAFKDGRRGSIFVDLLESDNQIELCIKDDGPGIKNGKDFFAVSSLGARLIKGLSQQLKGTLHIDGTNGLLIRLSIPVQAARKSGTSFETSS